MADSKGCPTRSIEDTPAEDDLLASHGDIGPHKRVAWAIAEVIRSPDESGGKMIGLEGGWGAGKTTIINLMRKELEGTGDIAVISFDAWAHEGDPLRRTYLESLIRHFRSIGWIKQLEWGETLETLAKRRRVTNTRTVPKTTTLGKVFAISVFLVPLGSPFLLTSLPQGITIDLTRPFSWMFIIGLLLTSAPFLVLGGNLLRIGWKRCRKNRRGGASPQGVSGSDQDVSYWAFLVGNSITETKQDSTETPEPTSIEFEDHFRKLMHDALLPGSNRQAVIVLDNLDRVEPQDAYTIWATLQTFLQDRSTGAEQWFKKLWIIVPYDPTGLRQLWTNRRLLAVPQVEEIETVPSEHDDTEYVVSDSFIDKSFQLRFQVPPPVLSNWKTYLNQLVTQALPKHSEDDRNMIYQVFRHCRTRDGQAPTPRELKLYLNQITVIHRQWQHEFPIGHVAYCAILRRKHTNIPKMLLQPALPDPQIESLLPSGLRQNLAGLAFNVPANLGQQLLLGDPIYEALTNNEPERLEELATLHKQGFWAVIEEVVTSRLPDTGAKSIANTALCLDQSQLVKDRQRGEIRTILQSLRRAASSIKSWSPFDEDLGNGIATTCRLLSDLDFSTTIVTTLRKTIGHPEKKDEIFPDPEVGIVGLVTIFKELEQLGHLDALGNPFTLPVDAQNWIGLCSHLAKQERKYWRLFTPLAKGDDISHTLSTAVTSGQFTEHSLTPLYVTEASPITCNWDDLAVAFEQRLNAHQTVSSSDAVLLMQGLSFLEGTACANAQTAAKRLTDGGHLMHRLHLAQSEKDDVCKAWCIVSFLKHRPDATAPQQVGHAVAGHKTLLTLLSSANQTLGKSLISVLVDLDRLDLLFAVVDGRNQYDPLIIQCLRIVATNDEPEAVFTPLQLIKRWPALVEHLGDEELNGKLLNNLVAQLCQRASLADHVQNHVDGFQREKAGLYTAVCKASSSSSFLEWCRVGLVALVDSDWKLELESEGDALKLLLALIDAGTNVLLKQPYEDALVEYAKSVLSGSAQVSEELVSRRSQILAARGEDNDREILRHRLLDAAMGQQGKWADRFFDMFGDELANVTTLTKDEEIIWKLFSPLVKERSIGGLRWLRGVFTDNPGLLGRYGDAAAVRHFRERLEGEMSTSATGDNEADRLISEIGRSLGIIPLETPPEGEALTEREIPGEVGREEGSGPEE